MGNSINIKRWFWWHRWTSLICTLFLLLLCLTGLPLIFGEEIDDWLEPSPPYAVMPENSPRASLDTMVNYSLQKNPGLMISSIFVDDDEPQVIVNLATSWKQAMTPHSDSTRWVKFDARTAKVIQESKALGEEKMGFTDIMLELHRRMFMGLGGELFLGLMGMLFVVAIISGFVLYGPFMKKLDFGTIRARRSSRLKWLDLHNLLGIVTGLWLFVVGLTGVINEFSVPLFGIWQLTDVNKMLTPYKGKPVPQQLSSVEAAYDSVAAALPDMSVTSVVFPGAPYSSSQHYLLWAKGNTPLKSRLFSPCLVDAKTGRLSVVLQMPWYLRGLEVSRPLHFGDYGGMPLKVIWAILDVLAIVVLWSGIYLWFKRKRTHEDYFLKQQN
ncbi:MAG: PepSY domain-containing protein [Bacteroidetes bacterium]|nr:PepSY domain-containing protein [Bacteroidota bacterium]